MKRVILVIIAIASIASAVAGDFAFKFYGQIRADLFYNSRANQETADGLFYMYPKDVKYDAAGHDLNASPGSNMYMLYTRLGVEVKGPRLGSALTSAVVELDFRGSGSSFAVPRMRHAYVGLDWQHSHLLVGQTWHPLMSDVRPTTLNISSGAPFQPFNRSPQIRYRYSSDHGWSATGALVWQMQNTSAGPDGNSASYLKNGCVPEIFAGVDYHHDAWTIGAGAEFLSIRPRKTSTIDDRTYKVSERVNSISAEIYGRYAAPAWSLAAKTMLASNLTQASMLGGYAATHVDSRTGECRYTPMRHSSSWINFVYGRRWQPALFVGYIKNLGTGRRIVGPQYGDGLGLDQLFAASAQLSFNIPHWKFGIEFTPAVAWYGNENPANGRIDATHSVVNYRVLASAIFSF